MLFGTIGLKINLIVHLLLVGTSLAAEVANKLVAAFFNLGIEIILNVLNYCKFKEYSKCILMIPNVPIGRIICISLYPDVPIGRITKSHEEVHSFVIRVISTLQNILLY